MHISLIYAGVLNETIISNQYLTIREYRYEGQHDTSQSTCSEPHSNYVSK